jgi:hypothetical protein
MTQQYIAGEFSSLIGELQQVGGGLLVGALRDLRSRVEHTAVASLPPLVSEAIAAADTICWISLERGDLVAFSRQTATAAALHEFAVCAGLLR